MPAVVGGAVVTAAGAVPDVVPAGVVMVVFASDVVVVVALVVAVGLVVVEVVGCLTRAVETDRAVLDEGLAAGAVVVDEDPHAGNASAATSTIAPSGRQRRKPADPGGLV